MKAKMDGDILRLEPENDEERSKLSMIAYEGGALLHGRGPEEEVALVRPWLSGRIIVDLNQEERINLAYCLGAALSSGYQYLLDNDVLSGVAQRIVSPERIRASAIGPQVCYPASQLVPARILTDKPATVTALVGVFIPCASPLKERWTEFMRTSKLDPEKTLINLLDLLELVEETLGRIDVELKFKEPPPRSIRDVITSIRVKI